MPDTKNKAHVPGTGAEIKKRETPVVKAFQPSEYDKVYPEGEIIDIDSDIEAGYIVRQGSVTVEMILPAPGGLMTIGLDTVEAGEYFNIQSLFRFKLEDGTNLRYRAQCRTVIMRVTPDMVPKDPHKLIILLRSFMQTATRREGKLRQLTGYALQRNEEKRADRGGNSQLLNKYRTELENRKLRILELEQLLVEQSDAKSKVHSPAVKSTELEKSNAVLRRDKLELSQALKKTEEELKKVRGNFLLEERTRKALEQRNADLTQQLAARSAPVSSVRFPSANILLESSELNDLETSAKNFRKAAAHFEGLATMMQRAMELIAEDNPGMVISEDVMMLMTGQEPAPRASVKKARAHRDSADFKTLHLGTKSPESAIAKSYSDESEPEASPDPEWVDTSAETPYAKQEPTSLHGGALPKHKQTDRNLGGLKAPGVKNATAADGTAIHSEGSLSQMDVNAILAEFVEVETQSAGLEANNPPPSSGVSVPYPENPTWDEPDTGSRQTKPFIPDDGHLATNSEIDIPLHPNPPDLNGMQSAKPPQNSTKNNSNISGKHLHSKEFGKEFPQYEADSDITPVLPEYPSDVIPSSRAPASKQSPSWRGNTFFGRSEETAHTDQREIPTKREGSESGHPAINFPDESTDIRQIQEEWRNKLQQPIHSHKSKNQSASSTSDTLSPPPEIIVESESDEDISALSDAEWADSAKIRTTKAYQFPAPGKPPKPSS